ncbi:MAG: hypothetical protein ED557_13430 [Balneola sp.]|nr:MAG: hypothetical protein ED557_13430 [Balneola sp.]
MKNIALSISVILLLTNDLNGQSLKLKELNLGLKEGYNYGFYSINDNHLVYAESYTNTVYVFDVDKNELIHELKISKGRGPNELNGIQAAIYIEGRIYLGEENEFKILMYNTLEGTYESIVNRYISPSSFMNYKKRLIIENGIASKSLFIDAGLPINKNPDIKEFDFSPIDLLSEFEHFFFKEGTQVVIGDKMIFSAMYKPDLYVFDIPSSTFVEKISFDVGSVSMPKTVESGGATFILSPDDPDIKTNGVGYVDELSEDHIILLSTGKGSERKYSLNEILIYDYKREKVVAKYSLGFKARNIISGDGKSVLFDPANMKSYLVQIED